MKRRRVIALALLALSVTVAGCGADRSLSRISQLTGITVPTETQLAAYTDDVRLLELAQSWLTRFPASAERGWVSSPAFVAVPPSPQPAEDYLTIRAVIHDDFPAFAPRFQRPRIWRGGKDGNCYIASSDDDELVYFHYFTT